MNIVVGLPPIYDKIIEAGIAPPVTAVYTYGDTIYTPSGGELSEDLIAHEETHAAQQAKLDHIYESSGPMVWWANWISDPSFRANQELAAYQAQFRYFKSVRKDRNEQARFATTLARDLAGPMYGHSTKFSDAYRRITE